MDSRGEWQNAIVEESSEVGETRDGSGSGPHAPVHAKHEFVLEPELAPPPPRPIPSFLLHGSYERRWRQRAFSGLVLAVSMLTLARLELLTELSYYILALGYLDWIGLGILALVAGSAVSHLLRRGRYRYVREGIPVSARVLACDRVLQGQKDFPSFAFAVHVEYTNPETRAVETKWVHSGNIDQARSAERYALPIRAGDEVTAVGLPGRFAESLQLYGFLGLNPGVEYVLKDGRPVREVSALAVLLISVGIVGLLALVLAGLYVVQFLEPIGNVAPAAWGAAGGAGLALALALAFLKDLRGSPDGRGKAQRWLVRAGCALLGALAGFVGVSAGNAAFDRSAMDLRDVQVVNFWQETWYPLFVRRYEIEYAELDGGEKRKHPARVETMAGFELGFGVIDVGRGALGMEWVRGIHPVALTPLLSEDPPDKAIVSALVDSPGGEKKEIALKPVVRLPGEKVLDPSPALVARIREIVAAK